MALDPALMIELRQMLSNYRAANGPSAVPTGAGKALEAWVLMRLAEVARLSGGWRVSLRQANGTPIAPGASFNLPVSQSGIPPSSSFDPCHVHLQRSSDSLSLEIHGSLQWKGRSGTTHECDVSVLPENIAYTLRTNGGGHPHGLPVSAYECKDKVSVGGTDEMRQTVARLFDLVLVTRPLPGMVCRIYEDATNIVRWGARSSTYRSSFAKGAFGVVRAGRFSTGATSLGMHYYVERHSNVYDLPSSIADVEVKFGDVLSIIDELI